MEHTLNPKEIRYIFDDFVGTHECKLALSLTPSDYPWGLDDFIADCPKDVIYTNFRPLSETKVSDPYMKMPKSKVSDQFLRIAKKGCLVVPLVKDDAEAAAWRVKIPAGHFLGTMKEVSI